MKKLLSNSTRRYSVFRIGMALLFVGLAYNTATAQNDSGRIAGTWDAEVTLVNCQTGAMIRTFDSLGMFMAGGTMIDSTSGIPQAAKTPGQGVWAHIGGNRYLFRFKHFSFDAGGNYTGYQIVTHEAHLDRTGDAYTSFGTAEFYTPAGNLLMTGCSRTTATRFGL